MKKLTGWKEKLLFGVGKEMLIKAVAQAILTYMMFVYKLPKGLINELNSVTTKFWWGSSMRNRGIYWIS